MQFKKFLGDFMAKKGFQNTTEFKRAMDQYVKHYKNAERYGAIQLREDTYKKLKENVNENIYNSGSPMSYQRTYALRNSIKKDSYKIANGYEIIVYWDSRQLASYKDRTMRTVRSKTGIQDVMMYYGTHRSWKGSNSWGVAKGQAVETPVILDMYKDNYFRKYHQTGMITDTANYIQQHGAEIAVKGMNTYLQGQGITIK
jgi:hypothetical protein